MQRIIYIHVKPCFSIWVGVSVLVWGSTVVYSNQFSWHAAWWEMEEAPRQGTLHPPSDIESKLYQRTPWNSALFVCVPISKGKSFQQRGTVNNTEKETVLAIRRSGCTGYLQGSLYSLEI